jgi:hypothetical protein
LTHPSTPKFIWIGQDAGEEDSLESSIIYHSFVHWKFAVWRIAFCAPGNGRLRSEAAYSEGSYPLNGTSCVLRASRRCGSLSSLPPFPWRSRGAVGDFSTVSAMTGMRVYLFDF